MGLWTQFLSPSSCIPIWPNIVELEAKCSLSKALIGYYNYKLTVWQFYWFRPQGPQDMAGAHKKQSKTLANLSYSRQLYTPQHTRDEAIGDVIRNKYFNDLE